MKNRRGNFPLRFFFHVAFKIGTLNTLGSSLHAIGRALSCFFATLIQSFIYS
jgi:hypothetical protein